MLIKQGHIATVRTTNPVNRCPQDVVMPSELERFQKEYVSLYTLAKEQGLHFRAVKKKLEAADVKPAFDPEQVGATFYRWADTSL
jgi:isopropylmalate/homocitrate/citramalate synthase